MPRDPKIVSRTMAAIRSKGTVPEILLGKALWSLGLRYKKHYKLPGSPDFVFTRVKIAVFCDGDFWHGNKWRLKGFNSLEEELASYSEFWVRKITSNVARDNRVNETLKADGWHVIRFWESDIKQNPLLCAKQVQEVYEQNKREI
jgi:DNA mismatch endonuclease (patch repair protein)